jgi:dienelactone hydrolase
MTDSTAGDRIRRQRVVYTMPGMDRVTVRSETYRVTDSGALTLDLYYPPEGDAAPKPAVVLVTGFSDAGAVRMFGSPFKDMGAFGSWAELIAASGMTGITYLNHEPRDIHDVLEHVRRNAASLRIDPGRIGLWACSGHGPNALSVLIEHGTARVRCACLLYPYTMDLNGATRVAAAAAQFRFVTPAAQKSIEDLPLDVPIAIARAGRDAMPGLNEALDAFAAASLARNLPLTLVNHPSGQHAFDLSEDSATSRAAITQALAFLRSHLGTG